MLSATPHCAAEQLAVAVYEDPGACVNSVESVATPLLLVTPDPELVPTEKLIVLLARAVPSDIRTARRPVGSLYCAENVTPASHPSVNVVWLTTIVLAWSITPLR